MKKRDELNDDEIERVTRHLEYYKKQESLPVFDSDEDALTSHLEALKWLKKLEEELNNDYCI
jgi:hypothetical protein